MLTYADVCRVLMCPHATTYEEAEAAAAAHPRNSRADIGRTPPRVSRDVCCRMLLTYADVCGRMLGQISDATPPPRVYIHTDILLNVFLDPTLCVRISLYVSSYIDTYAMYVYMCLLLYLQF